MLRFQYNKVGNFLRQKWVLLLCHSQNGWLDDENRAYIIYTVDAIMEDLDCGKDKAIKVLAELDTNKGIGLVERIRRGLGKPDIIYVKNFVISQEKAEDSVKTEADSDTFAEDGKADFKDRVQRLIVNDCINGKRKN